MPVWQRAGLLIKGNRTVYPVPVEDRDMNDRERAKNLLAEGAYTCAICSGEKVYTSHERGVKPLLDLLEQGAELKGFSAADRVVGKAAAFLYVLLGVSAVYAGVMSRPAAGVFRRFGIEAEADEQVEVIANRSNTGLCPMESAVWNIDRPEEALEAVKKKLRELRG